jgi:ATP synthase protein I
MRAMGPYLSLGWNFAVTVGLGLLAGWWLDRKLRTGPWLTVIGIALGIAAAFVQFFRVVLPRKGKE